VNANEIVDVTVNGAKPAKRPMSRRESMQWVLAAVAAGALPGCRSNPAGTPQPASSAPPGGVAQEVGRNNAAQELAAKQPDPTGVGYGTDPVLARNYKPGEVWPLTFTDTQKKAATTLADTILPADQYGPAASAVGVVEMLDEWVSAPYPQQRGDRPIVLDGLKWIDAESTKRFEKPFAELDAKQRTAICDDICSAKRASKEFAKAAGFFSRFRDLCASAYYATPAGWKAIGYVGNVALERFDGPPQEVLDKLGVTQTVA
jgi:hypothetical protein